MKQRLGRVVVLVGAAMAWPPTMAWAQAPSASASASASVEAEELFQQGRRALEAHDCAEATVKLAASLELEPAVGTLISLAECEEQTQKLASARLHWQQAAILADAKRDPLHRGPFARRMFEAVDPRVPRLLVRLAPAAPASAVFQRDDVALGRASLGTEVPIDPGEHTVAVSAPGHETKSYSFRLREGEHKVLDVEPGQVTAEGSGDDTETVDEDAPRSGPPQASSAQATDVPKSVSARAHAGDPVLRTLGYVSGALGILGVATGSYFGLRTFSQWSKAKADCATSCGAGSAAQNEQSDAAQSATVSTVSFSIGSAALAAGFILLIMAPTVDPTSNVSVLPAMGSGQIGLLARGSW